MKYENINIRTNVTEADKQNVREILESSKFFHDFEVDVAVELVQEYLDNGPDSGYIFLFAEVDGKTVGYSCFGFISITKRNYDLYWIGVHEDYRGYGLGKIMMKEIEKTVKALGGKSIYIETSSRDIYMPTQKFYTSYGCDLIARITDFYNDGDDKLIYRKDV